MAGAFSRLMKNRRFHEVVGLVLMAGAVVTFLAVASYDYGDASLWFRAQPDGRPLQNWVGRAGATLAEGMLQMLGTTSLLVPLVLAWAGWNRFRGKKQLASYGVVVGMAVLCLALAALLDLLFNPILWGGETFRPGGLTGSFAAKMLRSIFNKPGALVITATVVAAVIILITRVSLGRIVESMFRHIGSVTIALLSWLRQWYEERRRAARKRSMVRNQARRATSRQTAAPKGKEPEPQQRRPSIAIAPPEPSPTKTTPKPESPAPATRPASPEKKKKPAGARQRQLPLEPGKVGYVLPPLELLNDPEKQEGEDEKSLLERAELLTRKFREFAVDGSVVAIHPGPVVTTFEFKPDAGVKYSKITALTDDLCLALRAESVRIDRIPGKSTVGIEVPNRIQEIIFPKELIGSDRFRSSGSKLTMALGKDIGGEVFVTELDKMPHLLIAGATGAGKSVGLNGMITSILYKATPEEVRFIMIDTKMIELGIYAEIPHLLIPVVTEPKAASTALKWAVREMEIRYRKLASVGVRNIAQFNTLLGREPEHTMINERTGEEAPLQPLPYIVIVIDEMADLMMVSSADVEESVMRLAQMARAVGIHLILATQRPSVDVITGTIKANFPCRVAYRVSQRVDSRTIIDQQGAEHLLGQGDMLFLPPGSARLLRLHGGYITEPELGRITTFLKRSARPVYDDTVLKEPEEERPEYEDTYRDDKFMQAVELILQEGQCSITLIQRRMRLGYARAARIVDSMEQAGIIGPADGSKPREVLVGPEVLETLRNGE